LATKKGQLIAEWDDGMIFTTGSIDSETGKVDAKFVETKELGSLISIAFECNDGDIFHICVKCHAYSLKWDINKEPKSSCPNPECESNVKLPGLFDNTVL